MTKLLTDKFANSVNDLVDFESVFSVAKSEDNLYALELSRVELNSLWDQVKKSYVDCRDSVPAENEKPVDKNKLRAHYKEALISYQRVMSSLNDEIQTLGDGQTKEKMERNLKNQPSGKDTDVASISRLPPCDTDTFHGGYQAWPSFRDLFSTLYIQNNKLSNVEKLFHLTQKTAGEAREIISLVPLTHDGFEIAWKNLLDRYENNRMQVNDQLKTLFNLPNVSADSGNSIQKLQRTVKGCIQTLESLKIITKDWDPIIIYLCSTKLPRTILEEFENTLVDCASLPTWTEFDTFLTHKFKTLESVRNIKPTSVKNNQSGVEYNKSAKNWHDKRIQSFQTNVSGKPQKFGDKDNRKQSDNNNEQKCPLCKASHFLKICPQFLAKTVNDRIHIVKISHLCYNCLSSRHGIRECKSRFNCRNCNQRHNTLLHKGVETQATTQQMRRDDERPSTSSATLTTMVQTASNLDPATITTLTLQNDRPTSTQHHTTLLFTAIVQIESKGQRYDTRALIDPGSQSTFISEKLKNRLKLPIKRNLVHVTGLSQLISETSTQTCLFNLCSRVDPCFKIEVWAPVLKTLPSNLPSKTINTQNMPETGEFNLADPHFNTSRPIDILIGMDIGPLIFKTDVPSRSFGSMLAQKTVFGWIVGGPIKDTSGNQNIISLCSTSSIEKILTKFWEVEETPKKKIRSEEDKFCEENFKNTTRRNNMGRYIVSLPFKSCEELGASRNIAMAQLNRLERKLEKTPEVKEQYAKAIMEYLELGHMKKIPHQDINKTPHYYLPHHAVIKPDRVTTKLRVVFNASSPTSNKRSLNDNLYPGPVLQQDLVLQILKWRFFKFAFNADVTKMYRQILVDPSQAQYQRILFRLSPNDPIQDFELLTVTFGVTCTPFLALRVLIQLAEDVRDKYPLATKIILQNLYVDDVLAGGHTLEEAIQSREELIAALDSAGFNLMKWASNDPQVLRELPPDSLLLVDWLNISEGVSTKTLGIRWDISLDSFTFVSPIIEIQTVYTKRNVLSIIAQFFDPCGWLAPIIVVAKLIMQQIWLDKIDWDDDLKILTSTNWINFVTNCSLINSITIPRWIQYDPKSNMEIHGFCDASEKAYAAAVYVRIQKQDKGVHTFLLAAKTRVAPIQKKSLPRLELCGAVLLSELASSIIPKLQVSNFMTHYWTDSTIVLAWLKKPPCSWSTFVGNRVSEIIENVGNENWHHVDSEYNPADIASRGCTPNELQMHKLWWYGPPWLTSPRNQWPKVDLPLETELEAKSVRVFTTTTFEDPLMRFSSLSRAYRVLAYVVRFWKNTGKNRTHLRSAKSELTSWEIQDVKTRLITVTQKHYFAEEHQSLTHKRRISPRSSLISLNPFLDDKGVIRANGRLTQSPALTYNERHPILLPYDSRLTQLLAEFTHKITLHGGNQLMTRVLRTEFWIFRLKPLVKKVIHNCRTCLLYKQHTQTQIMSSLPPERTTLARPFSNTGVDFAGPFNIKNYTGRACLITKGYVCLFVCFSTKAIHLEATSDLSTQSFLAAFSRFMGRRGCPAKIYSDNGTNFVGAAEMLRKDRIEFCKQLKCTVEQQNVHQNLEWKFIPPGAPHMGGLWEAGVKSFKIHLKKSIPHINLTFEEFSTILARIEGCLNSRPLSPASDDPTDLSPLTPGHFLIGTSFLTPAETDSSDENITVANRWKRLKIISQHFCQRWKSEYLTELHRRYKWKYQQENIKVNDLVIIRDEKLAPNEWKMGRIIKTYQGIDRNTRVVDIKTANGTTSRPITKLVKLFSD